MGIKIRRLCQLVKKYRKDPQSFSIGYNRKKPTRAISSDIENNIVAELKFEKDLIENRSVSLRSYNYSYIRIRDSLKQHYSRKVSLSTVIDRAKRYGFYIKKSQKKAYNREAITNYIEELIQHDSSHHRWNPYAEEVLLHN